MQRLDAHNPGVISIDRLKIESDVTIDDFLYEAFKRANGGEESYRDLVKYNEKAEVSFSINEVKVYNPDIQICSMKEIQKRRFPDLSNDALSKECSTIQKIIASYVLCWDGLDHLFCGLSSHKSAAWLYMPPLASFLLHKLFTPRVERRAPLIIIVTKTREFAKKAFHEVRDSLGDCKNKVTILKLFDDGLLPEEVDPAIFQENVQFHQGKVDIVIGTSTEVLKYLKLRISDRTLFQMEMRYVVIEEAQFLDGANEFSTDVETIFRTNLISEEGSMACAMMFADAFTDLTPSRVFVSGLFSRKICYVLAPLRASIFEYIKLHDILPPGVRQEKLEFAMLRRLQSTGKSFHLERFSAIDDVEREVLENKTIQKLRLLSAIISQVDTLRSEKNRSFFPNRDRKFRAEKVLVVAGTSREAEATHAFMKIRKSWFKKNIEVLTSDTTEDKVEELNHGFRNEAIDVLVTDYASLPDIQRGIVDTVVLMDQPDEGFFGVIYEDTLRKLVSRNMLNLKLHIMVDVEHDVKHARNLGRFLLKNNAEVPQFLLDMFRAAKSQTPQGSSTSAN
ncbi:unnamed protein product [Caenorhabditis auriculariae]|uniref:Uncharacterized protein n=1 Tax=Caenorhabditis auriculariae TaxID=2777116 RepID=A0A8S1HE56_9PELO|nr:unnamed protein product [Caenorhabditis auriculariae]